MGATADRIAKSAGTVIVIASASKLLGLIRESITAAYFGAGYLTDAYRVAMEIPSILTGVLFAAITITFMPVYSELKDKTQEQRMNFVSNLFNVVLLLTGLIAISGVLLAPVLVGLVAPGFQKGTFELSVKLTMILCPSVIFLALAYLSNGFLQANRRFAVPASMGIPLNLIIILSIVFFHHHGIQALAAGSLLAMASQFFIQLPSILKAGFRFKPVIDFNEPGLKKVLALSVPVFISTGFNEISILADKILASGLDSGSISVLDYANKVNGLAGGIFFSSVAVVFFPELALNSDEPSSFGKAVATGLKIIILMSFPIMAGIWVLKQPIIRLLFERGEFNPSDTYFTSIILGLYSAGIIGTGLTAILNRVFYSLRDTKTPMINGIIAICANILFSLIGVRLWGVRGLAVSSALASLLCGLSLFVRVRKKVELRLGDIAVMAVKSAASAAVMGTLLYFLNSMEAFRSYNGSDPAGLFLKLAGMTGIGGLVYMGVLTALRTKEWMIVLDQFKEKFWSSKRGV